MQDVAALRDRGLGKKNQARDGMICGSHDWPQQRTQGTGQSFVEQSRELGDKLAEPRDMEHTASVDSATVSSRDTELFDAMVGDRQGRPVSRHDQVRQEVARH